MGVEDLTDLIKKIPGFRSGKRWKSLVASIFYIFFFLIILILITPNAPALALKKVKPTNKSSVSIEGDTEKEKTVYLLKDGNIIQSTNADSDGKFYFGLNDLTDGNFTYTVKACNSEKEKDCTSKNILIVVDRTPPEKPIIALPKELPEIEGEVVIISGKAEPESKVTAKLNDEELGEFDADKEGNFEIKTGLVLGVNTISVKAVDSVGNEGDVVTSEFEYQPSKYKVKSTRVIDGDTIEIEGGRRIRYIGVNTPETYECYYQQAKDKNKELVEGKEIIIEKDVSETDRYGRLLRYVWVDNIFVNEYLVREGYAQVATYPPDVKYQDNFLEAQREARENSRGLWGDVCRPSPSPEVKSVFTQPEAVQDTGSSGYICNCSKTCSQMLSCEEAYFQLNTCGCSVRDGDKDGVPCESICSGGGGGAVPPSQPETQPPGGSYSCNCSKTCPQMSSCDEAYYQLNQCGCSRRDGDGDGIPCESICQ